MSGIFISRNFLEFAVKWVENQAETSSAPLMTTLAAETLSNSSTNSNVELLGRMKKFEGDYCLVHYWIYLISLPVDDVEFPQKQEAFLALKEALSRIVEEYKDLLQLAHLPKRQVNESSGLFISYKFRIQQLENLLESIAEAEMPIASDDFSYLLAFCFKTYLMRPMALYRAEVVLSEKLFQNISGSLKGVVDKFNLLYLQHFAEIPEAEAVEKEVITKFKKYQVKAIKLKRSQREHMYNVANFLDCQTFRLPYKTIVERNKKQKKIERLDSLLSEYSKESTKTIEALRMAAEMKGFADPFSIKKPQNEESQRYFCFALFTVSLIVVRVAFKALLDRIL